MIDQASHIGVRIARWGSSRFNIFEALSRCSGVEKTRAQRGQRHGVGAVAWARVHIAGGADLAGHQRDSVELLTMPAARGRRPRRSPWPPFEPHEKVRLRGLRAERGVRGRRGGQRVELRVGGPHRRVGLGESFQEWCGRPQTANGEALGAGGRQTVLLEDPHTY